MTDVVHTFVDEKGVTYVDKLDLGSRALDMDSPPREYHVFLVTRRNARFIAERIKEFDDGRNEKRVMLACPADQVGDYQTKWEAAKVCVRQLCFENPHPVCGGIRPANLRHDYPNARILSMHLDVHRKVNESLNKEKKKSPKGIAQERVMTLVQEAHHEMANPQEMITTVSSHPLWKRLSWVVGVDPFLVFNLIGELVDPTWYVNSDRPKRSGLFKDRCGLYDVMGSASGTQAASGVWVLLTSPYAGLLNAGAFRVDPLKAPSAFFLRYGLRWMEYYLNEGADEQSAVMTSVWRYATKLANYIWLNWMEVAHGRSQYAFEEDRFFGTDVAAAKVSYTAACS